jgi:hypothetical protein
MSAILRLISLLCSLVLLVSFAMFATDQAGKGEKHTVAQIANGDDTSAPATAPTAPVKKKHGPVRSAIESANAKLVAPFDGMVATDSPWTKHIIETVLAFLVFGVGIGFAARYAATRGA